MPPSPNPPAKPARTAWLISPLADFSFFIATPLAIVPLFHLFTGWLSLTALKIGVLSVSATGHHLPGFIRAYTDGRIFSRFKSRLIVVPALFILLTAAAAYLKLSLIFWVLIVWSTWHGAMQVLGFLRIYDVKSGFPSALTARLDFLMCLSWFIQVVLWSPPKKMSVLSSFYLAGGPIIPLDAARLFERAWLAFTAAVTLLYVVDVVRNRLRQGYFNLPKQLCLLASVGFWGYCMISVNHLVIGLILWEIFHDLQYNAFVWSYNRNRVSRNLSESRIEAFLFRMDWSRIAIYAACIAAYGCIGILSQDVLNVYQNGKTYESLLYQIGNVFAASALIHFYLDGFIWKVRDGKVQRDLGVQAADAYRSPGNARHWALVSLFLLAAVGLGASEHFHWNTAQQRRQTDNLADLVPRSGYANFMKASALKAENRLDSAIHHYEQAMRHDTAYNVAHAFVADLKLAVGDTAGAIRHFGLAVEMDPEDPLLLGNLANLYLLTGRYADAEAQYRLLAGADSLNAEFPYLVGFALLQQRRGLDAKAWLERSLRLDPGQPRAFNYLGMIEQAMGHGERAQELYRKSLALDSTYAHARQNLAGLKLNSP